MKRNVHRGFKNKCTFNCLFYDVRVRLINHVLIALLPRV